MEEALAIEHLIASHTKLALLDFIDAERVISAFRRINRETGVAVYQWTPDEGLQRLGIEHIHIPHTTRCADVLEYIHSSPHYGIYLLRDFKLRDEDWRSRQLLNKISTTDYKDQHTIVLIGEQPVLPADITPLFVRVH